MLMNSALCTGTVSVYKLYEIHFSYVKGLEIAYQNW